jgi:hypothetical protein
LAPINIRRLGHPALDWKDSFSISFRVVLACKQGSARREGNEEKRDGSGTCKDHCQAAGEDVIGVHGLAFIYLAISPLCFVNDQMGTCVPDEHC